MIHQFDISQYQSHQSQFIYFSNFSDQTHTPLTSILNQKSSIQPSIKQNYPLENQPHPDTQSQKENKNYATQQLCNSIYSDIKNKVYSKSNLDKKFNIYSFQRKNLSRQWISQVIKIITDKIDIFDVKKNNDIKMIKKRLKQATIQNLVNIVSEYRWVYDKIVQRIENGEVAECINKDENIRKRIILLKSYPIFENLIQNPDSFYSWDLKIRQRNEIQLIKDEKVYNNEQLLRKLKQSNSYLKYNNKRQKLNFSQCWIMILKDILIHKILIINQIQDQCRLVNIIKNKKYTLQNLKILLQNSSFSNIIYNYYVDGYKLVNQIARSKKFTLIKKIQLLQSYPIFLNLLQNPSQKSQIKFNS